MLIRFIAPARLGQVKTRARAVVVSVFLPRLRETRLVRPISPTALAIRVIRANIVAEWLFELLPSRGRATKKREG
ncbi:MAG: hypothetical protein WD823_04665 [Sulfuricaulis sp.]|uniref:hypothetical protein n=1 Tax=Sulfuricaulis sp. TaxID=2003553 RepID=UPI0034A328D0